MSTSALNRPRALAAVRSARSATFIAATLIAVRLRLTFGGLTVVRQRMLPANPVTRGDPWAARRVGKAVTLISHLIPFASCLTQAQACQIVLARRGIASELFLGVRTDRAGVLRAHAWLRVGGKLITGEGPDLGAFRVLATLGPSR